MLDATAGNRMMWPNKNPPNVIFMDRETRLIVPPDIFGDYRQCPFRDNIFDCVIFDLPHAARGYKFYKNFKAIDPKSDGFYGWNITKIELLSGLHKAQKEFARISPRLCLKWSDVDWGLWNILPFFEEWDEVHRMEFKIKSHRKTQKLKTWWVTFIRSSLRTAKMLNSK